MHNPLDNRQSDALDNKYYEEEVQGQYLLVNWRKGTLCCLLLGPYGVLVQKTVSVLVQKIGRALVRKIVSVLVQKIVSVLVQKIVSVLVQKIVSVLVQKKQVSWYRK